MPPRTKRSIYCRQISSRRFIQVGDSSDDDDHEISSMSEAPPAENTILAALITGNGYKQLQYSSYLANRNITSEASFYRNQKKVIDIIHKNVQEQVHHFAAQISDNSKLGGDGHWNHARNGSAHTSIIYDFNQNKVVGYGNIEKSNGTHPGNFSGAYNMMETAGVEKALDDISPFLGNKIEFTHDHDNKTSKILTKKFGERVSEIFDCVHVNKKQPHSFRCIILLILDWCDTCSRPL